MQANRPDRSRHSDRRFLVCHADQLRAREDLPFCFAEALFDRARRFHDRHCAIFGQSAAGIRPERALRLPVAQRRRESHEIQGRVAISILSAKSVNQQNRVIGKWGNRQIGESAKSGNRQNREIGKIGESANRQNLGIG